MNTIDFHKSTAAELLAIKDRVRNLINHWGEDGRYKEAVIKTMIQRFLPEKFKIGTPEDKQIILDDMSAAFGGSGGADFILAVNYLNNALDPLVSTTPTIGGYDSAGNNSSKDILAQDAHVRHLVNQVNVLGINFDYDNAYTIDGTGKVTSYGRGKMGSLVGSNNIYVVGKSVSVDVPVQDSAGNYLNSAGISVGKNLAAIQAQGIKLKTEKKNTTVTDVDATTPITKADITEKTYEIVTKDGTVTKKKVLVVESKHIYTLANGMEHAETIFMEASK